MRPFTVPLPPFGDLRLAVVRALPPTLSAICARPRLLLRPGHVSSLLMDNAWTAVGPAVDEDGRRVKAELITPHAYGVVLDIGAGHGHTVHYLDRTRVTRYIAVEPNTLMHPRIQDTANNAGYNEDSGSLLILGCGIQDTEHVLSTIGTQVDTLISILTLCSVPAPQQTIAVMIDQLLKPGGQLLFYEHVLNHRPDIARWQRFWAPIWPGCRLDQPTDVWIEEMDGWDEKRAWGKAGEAEDHMFFHRVGRYTKAAS